MRASFSIVIGAVLAVCLGCGVGSRGSFAYVPVPPLDSHRSLQHEESTANTVAPAVTPNPTVEAARNETVPLVDKEPGAPKVEPEPPKPAAKAPVIPLKLVRGDPSLKKIALTFDDGPHAGFTEELIRVLKEFNVPATFFFIGRNVDANPELARKAYDAGMELASHTYSHTRLPVLDEEQIRNELEGGATAIEKATGYRPRFYRPPGGEYDDRVAKITRELKMTMVLWTSDAGDYTTPLGNPSSDAILQKVMHYIGPGGIVIMHDPMPSTLKALPLIITSLRAQGYEFVTVSQMAADPRSVTIGGPRIQPRHAAAVQVLADQGRYPTPNSKEAKNASSEQRAKAAATPQGTADQGTDQRG